METNYESLFGLGDQTAVVTGGGGGLGSEMVRTLATAGAKVAVLTRRSETSRPVADAINTAGGRAMAVACDVTDKGALEQARASIENELGPVDILVNAAGGNRPLATSMPDRSFFELDEAAVREVLDLNFMGTFLACQVFGQAMAERGRGSVINISSMAALRPLTRVVAYGAAKAAVDNFTRWLAVHMAREHHPAIRVNAIAPGFFLTEQNRYLLTDHASGQMTPRGQSILDHTPAARLGNATDLAGVLLWLAGPSASFVTGTVIPVDGGFAAFGGV